MATPQSRLFKEALDLTEKDRAELAGLLIDSLDAEEGEGVDRAWISEVDSRLAALDKGHTKTIPWEEAKILIRHATIPTSQISVLSDLSHSRR
jgi:putative addiction module component (TIGR02574 family)